MALRPDRRQPGATAERMSDAEPEDARDTVEQLGDALAAMVSAAPVGEELVKEVAARYFSDFVAGVEANVVERVGRHWRYANGGNEISGSLSRLLDDVWLSPDIVRLPDVGVVVPAKPLPIGVLLSDPTLHSKYWTGLRILAIGFGMALDSARQTQGKIGALEEIAGFQQISRLVLRMESLDELFSSICSETLRMLSADICGVFLREGDDLVMRDCIGNQTKTLRTIRLRQGQGLAGRVLLTNKHCIVGDYLTSEILSQDYADLVRSERIRSALGAPLRVNERTIGVLEVWRRRPSTFIDADVRRIITLSDLTAIAINNAELYEKQMSIAHELTSANVQLSERYAAANHRALVTDEVLRVVVSGEALSALVRVVAKHADAEIVFLTTDLEPMAGLNKPAWLDDCLPAIGQAVSWLDARQTAKMKTLGVGDCWLTVHPIVAVQERVGWACALGSVPPTTAHQIAIGQGAMACALHYMESRAAANAQAGMHGSVLWDLLEGAPSAREAALLRAREMQIDIGGRLRVVHLVAETLNNIKPQAFDAEAPERGPKTILDAFQHDFGQPGEVRLMAGRGNQLVAVVAGETCNQLRSKIGSVEAAITRKAPGLRLFWGVSSPCTGAGRLHTAHQEAASAVHVARKIDFGSNLAIHDELGVVSLLTKVRSDVELSNFVRDTLGAVISHDKKRQGALILTVRAYFECNCNQMAAARKLHVHEKTVKYRLTQFETLTGFSLDNHEDQVRAHLAIAMYALSPGIKQPTAD